MKYKDRDDDVWETLGSGRLKCVERASGSSVGTGGVLHRGECEEMYGPLRPLDSPDDTAPRTVRAEVAEIFRELADQAYSDYRLSEGVDADVSYKIYELFDAKAKALREESA